MWYKQAQQGRLNLDTQTGVENFRGELKALITKSLVKHKYNPLLFVVDFNKLNSLLKASPLSRFVDVIGDIRILHKVDPSQKNVRGQWDSFSKQILIPAVYNSDNYTTFLHEVVHSIDPVGRSNKLNMKELEAKDMTRPYFNQRSERLSFFENLHTFYSEEKLNKVLEIFYIKNKKKYPTKEIAIKAFMDDFKNYMQNPEESILLQTSRFHSYMVAANNGDDTISSLIMNSHKPLNNNEITSILGGVDPQSLRGREKFREYLRTHPERLEARDIQYYKQLQKFFSNVFTNTAKKIMPGYSAPVSSFDATKSIITSKNWLVKFWAKTDSVPEYVAQYWVDYLVFKRKDLFNKFISTLRTLNIVLDENFNFQDPRWQLLEPIVELLLNELIKYLENPEQYKTNLQTDEQRIIKQLNEEITKIINDKTILDKKAYFLEHWSDTLKKLGTLEQHELLAKFPAMSIEKGLQIMKNIGQK